MTTLEIRDMTSDKELDREAMSEIRGGMFEGFFGGIDLLSQDFFNKVTSISGTASIPTVQTNNLLQIDETMATNGDGFNGVNNNKFAAQSNSNVVTGLWTPSRL